MPPTGIRTHDLSRRAAADVRLRPRGRWDRLSYMLRGIINERRLSILLPDCPHVELDAIVAD